MVLLNGKMNAHMFDSTAYVFFLHPVSCGGKKSKKHVFNYFLKNCKLLSRCTLHSTQVCLNFHSPRVRACVGVCVCARMHAHNGADVCMYACVGRGGGQRLCLDLLRECTGAINFYAIFDI